MTMSPLAVYLHSLCSIILLISLPLSLSRARFLFLSLSLPLPRYIYIHMFVGFLPCPYLSLRLSLEQLDLIFITSLKCQHHFLHPRNRVLLKRCPIFKYFLQRFSTLLILSSIKESCRWSKRIQNRKQNKHAFFITCHLFKLKVILKYILVKHYNH